MVTVIQNCSQFAGCIYIYNIVSVVRVLFHYVIMVLLQKHDNNEICFAATIFSGW